MAKRIIFVDDEQNVLDGLERMFRPFRRDWDMRFCTSGAAALELMKCSKADVVVADMRMPGMNGVQLLAEVMRLYPDTVRIILSGHANEELIARSVGVTHQYLSKPCDPEALRMTVRKAVSLREVIHDDAVKAAISEMGSLPSLPLLYYEMVEVLQSPDPSVQKIVDIVSKDPGMTAKILQIVNSAFFGVRREVASPAQAVQYLGLDRIQQLCLSVHAFSQFEIPPTSGFSLEALWQHSASTASLARSIALLERVGKRMADESFTSGLLHDIGKLMIYSRMPEKDAEIRAISAREGLAGWEAEERVLGTNHAHVGAYLLGLWGLPDTIVEAVAYHHNPSDSVAGGHCPLVFVHSADVLDHNRSLGAEARAYDSSFLDRVGCANRPETWATDLAAIGA